MEHLTNISELEKLITDYKKQTRVCSEVNFEDKKSVKKNNRAVNRMYEIVTKINASYDHSGYLAFKKLLHDKQYKTNLWASIHILEKMSVDNETELLALEIIKLEAKISVGLDIWLEKYQSKY